MDKYSQLIEIILKYKKELSEKIELRKQEMEFDEHKRVKIIRGAGYIPVRLMFFKPNRTQAMKIQANLKKLYKSEGGEYYSGEEAWDYLQNETGVDLKKILIQSKE